MLIYILVVLALLVFIHLACNYNPKARLLCKIPGPRDVFLFGNALEIIVSPVELMKLGRSYAKRWDGIYRFWSVVFGAVMIYNPEDVEIITSNMKYNDKSLIYNYLHSWLRGGLLVSNGEKWQQRRKLLTPAFHFNILQQFFLVLEENSRLLVEVLGKRVGEDVDVLPVLSEFTLHSICETAMGTRLSEETTGAGRSYKEALYEMGKLLLHRFQRVYLFYEPVFNMTAVGKKMKDYLSVIHGFTARVIMDRREYVNKHGVTSVITDKDAVYKKRKTAMLDLLLLAEKDGLIDEVGIQEEVDTFMFEGHDTTASALTFCLMELANNKHIQDKIYSELYDIFGDSSRATTMEDLTKMRYLECCVKESLRIYPPVHFISRQLTEKVTLRQKFAMMEMKTAVAEVLKKFILLPVTRPDDIEFTADLVLRNCRPVYVSFAKR